MEVWKRSIAKPCGIAGSRTEEQGRIFSKILHEPKSFLGIE